MQYTIRNIPKNLDQRLRDMCHERRESLNKLVVDLLASAAGLKDEPVVHHDLDELSGTWVQDPEFDKAMEVLGTVDEDMWK